MRTISCLLLLIGITAAACGEVADEGTNVPKGSSPTGAADGGASSSLGKGDASSATIDSSSAMGPDLEPESKPDPKACAPGASPLPDGGTCDAARLRVSGPQCVQIGTYCDELTFWYDAQSQPDAALPAAFHCTKELGVTRCTYDFGNGAGHGYIDAAALQAACDVTNVSSSISVSCVVLEH